MVFGIPIFFKYFAKVNIFLLCFHFFAPYFFNIFKCILSVFFISLQNFLQMFKL